MSKKPIVLAVACAVALHLLAAASPVRAEPFRVLGFHFTLAAGAGRKEFCKTQFKKARELGYNTLFLMLSCHNGLSCKLKVVPGGEKAYTTAEMVEVLDYARSLGFTVIPEVKIWGKQQKTLGRDFIKKHPGICNRFDNSNSPLYDPFYKLRDGRGIHEAIVYPLMDEIIALFGKEPPRYFHIGFDEYLTDPIGAIAREHGLTAPQLFAQELNRITDHLLKKGITPIMFQDMLLHQTLAKPGHGVKGFKADPRFKRYTVMHAVYPRTAKASVLTAMDYVKNKDKIIVVDWHYGGGTPEGEYPSVDYFRAMGFKDVWGQTWHDERCIKTFAAYMKKADGTGMIASTYHAPWNSDVLHLYPGILHNSIIYFENPQFAPPPSALRLRVTEKSGTSAKAFFTPGSDISIHLELPYPMAAPVDAGLYLREYPHIMPPKPWQPVQAKTTLGPRKRSLRLDLKAPEAPKDTMVFYDCRADFVDGKTSYLSQAIDGCLFGVTARPALLAQGPTDPCLILGMDFNKAVFVDGQKQSIVVRGSRPYIGHLQDAVIKEERGAGFLDCNGKGGMFVPPCSDMLNQFASGGIAFEVAFMVTQKPGAGYGHVLFSYGHYHEGMRLFINRNRTMQGQVGCGACGPVRMHTRTPVSMNKWHTLRFVLDRRKREAAIYLDGKLETRASVPAQVPLPRSYPLGIGLEVKIGKARYQMWRQFPGRIRSFRVFSPPRIQEGATKRGGNQ